MFATRAMLALALCVMFHSVARADIPLVEFKGVALDMTTLDEVQAKFGKQVSCPKELRNGDAVCFGRDIEWGNTKADVSFGADPEKRTVYSIRVTFPTADYVVMLKALTLKYGEPHKTTQDHSNPLEPRTGSSWSFGSLYLRLDQEVGRKSAFLLLSDNARRARVNRENKAASKAAKNL